MLQEGFLNGGKSVPLREALNGGNVIAAGCGCQQQAAVHPTAIHQDRAGSALAMVAAFFGTGHAKMLA